RRPFPVAPGGGIGQNRVQHRDEVLPIGTTPVADNRPRERLTVGAAATRVDLQDCVPGSGPQLEVAVEDLAVRVVWAAVDEENEGERAAAGGFGEPAVNREIAPVHVARFRASNRNVPQQRVVEAGESPRSAALVPEPDLTGVQGVGPPQDRAAAVHGGAD